MSELGYSIFYKDELPISSAWNQDIYDVFVSAFNSSERVSIVFNKVSAPLKIWAIHGEYGYKLSEMPSGECFSMDNSQEDGFVISLIEFIQLKLGRPINELKVCIDLTGFMRPHILFLCRYLEERGVGTFDVLYTEPERYAKKENTTFSEGSITVRTVAGFTGDNDPDHSNDLLVIGSGYDHRLIRAVAEYKEKADKVQIYGLPSLRADMYQENVLNAYRAQDAIGVNKIDVEDGFFAPANDPFGTADTLRSVVSRRERLGKITNVYLSPLATKAQALGFALYYIGDCKNKSVHVIFPVSERYARETSHGLARVWRYRVEFPIY